MKIYPENLVEMMDMFPNEQSCIDYLTLLRWPDGYTCGQCSSKNSIKLGRGLYRCCSCKYECSVLSGTLFQNTHKPLRLWFQVIWYVVGQKNGVSALGLQKALGLGSYHTAWEWLHKLRRAMVRPDRDKLEGIIEVNEAWIGGSKPGKAGRGAEGKTLVLVAAEEIDGEVGRIRLLPIENTSGRVLVSAVKQIASKESTIRTDGWCGYSGLSQQGYTHLHCPNNDIKNTDVVSLTHLVTSLLKRWLLGTHQGAISHKHLPYYLDEFTFRFNRRTSRSRGKLFYRLIQNALIIGPVPTKSLTTTCSD